MRRKEVTLSGFFIIFSCMRLLNLSFLLCLLSSHVFAQQLLPAGNLVVFLTQNNNQINVYKNKICIVIQQHDSVLRKSCLGQNYRAYFGKLNVGKYDVALIVDDIKKSTVHSVYVDTLFTTSLTINLSELSYIDKNDRLSDSLGYPHSPVDSGGKYFTWNVLKGVRPNKQSVFLGNEFQFSLVWGFPLVRKKHFQLPFEFGFNTGYCKINGDTTLFQTKPTTTERYGFLNCSFGLLNTWRFLFDSATHNSRAMLQYGVAYNFPFIYNHTGISGNKRMQSQSLSTYENLYLTGRLAFGSSVKVGIQAEYNLGPHLKRQYPQPADFRFGLFYFQSF